MSLEIYADTETVSGLYIRPLCHRDAALVEAFYAHVLPQTRAIFGKYRFTKQHALEMAEETVSSSTHRYFVVVTQSETGNEEMVALFWFWDWTKKLPWFGIMIADAWQKRKLGRMMMSRAIAEAHRHGKGGILLTTAKTNERAQALYQRFSFEMIGEAKNGEYLMILNFPDFVRGKEHPPV